MSPDDDEEEEEEEDDEPRKKKKKGKSGIGSEYKYTTEIAAMVGVSIGHSRHEVESS